MSEDDDWETLMINAPEGPIIEPEPVEIPADLLPKVKTRRQV